MHQACRLRRHVGARGRFGCGGASQDRVEHRGGVPLGDRGLGVSIAAACTRPDSTRPGFGSNYVGR
jgi:hypothetical protein